MKNQPHDKSKRNGSEAICDRSWYTPSGHRLVFISICTRAHMVWPPLILTGDFLFCLFNWWKKIKMKTALYFLWWVFIEHFCFVYVGISKEHHTVHSKKTTTTTTTTTKSSFQMNSRANAFYNNACFVLISNHVLSCNKTEIIHLQGLYSLL